MEYLAYAFAGLPFAIAALLGLLIPLAILQAYREVGYGIAYVALLFAFETFFPGFEGIQLGVRLYIPDIVTLLIGLAALLRVVILVDARPRFPAWYVYLAVVFLSLGIGLATLGSQAGVAGRPYFYAVIVGSYVLSFPGDARMVRQLTNTMAWLSVGLVVVVLARWAITYIPIPELLPENGRFSSSEASLLRVVTSEKAVVVAQVLVVMMFYPQVAAGLTWIRPLLPMMLLIVVALQHRSVWLATVAAVAARFTLPQAGRKATAQLAALALVVIVVAIPIALSGRAGGAAADISRSAGRAIEMSDTANARLDSWQQLIGKWATSGPKAIAIGLPIGTSNERILISERGEATRVSFQAHNYYVQTIFNTGLVGIVSSLMIYAYVLLGLYRGLGDDELGAQAGAMLLLTIAQIVYYLPYGVHYSQGLVLGVAAALALTLNSRRLKQSPSKRGPRSRFGPVTQGVVDSRSGQAFRR